MAAPITPTGLTIQQGNTQVFLLWSLVSGATSYTVQRSTDGVTYSTVGTSTAPSYLDSAVTAATQYWYQVASVNGDGTSLYTSAATIVPTATAVMSLGAVRLLAQQRCDRVGSNFVTLPEWNTYINQSYFELYDLLVTTFEDYFVHSPYSFSTDGTTYQYSLPADFYKLLGVDLSVGGNNAWVTVKKFEFISRNRFVYPQVTSTYLGVFNLRYRLVGSSLYFIPTPSGGQQIRVWYVPKLTQLLQDTDTLDGVSGWTEYVVVDAARKALAKEESDTSRLVEEKMALIKRIEETAMNRDIGQPDAISDVRTRSEQWGQLGPPGDGGGYAGW